MLKSALRTALIRMAHSVLREPSIRTALWDIVQRGADVNSTRPQPVNPWGELWRHAGRQTVDYIEERMLVAALHRDRKSLMRAALRKADLNGLYLEFGSGWKAESINFLAAQLDAPVHGFDSLQGLPEDWFGDKSAGSHSSQGRRPAVRDNVELHIGWFDETLPEFLAHHREQASFIHIDCDVYSSTKTVFDLLGERVVPGTVIQFDEYFNYPGWRHHEFRAFQEFIAESGLDYNYLGYTTQFAVAVQIEPPAEARRRGEPRPRLRQDPAARVGPPRVDAGPCKARRRRRPGTEQRRRHRD